jgi:hypothetical protein
METDALYQVKSIILLTNFLIHVFSGFLGGCSVVDGLLHSTWACLFDQECVDELKTMLRMTDSIAALNASMFDHFLLPTQAVSSIMDRMFIESWAYQLNYSAYFFACAPSMCRYSYVGPSNIADILTTLLKLYSGLEVVLKLVVWYGLCLISAIIMCRRQRRQTAPFILAEPRGV